MGVCVSENYDMPSTIHFRSNYFQTLVCAVNGLVIIYIGNIKPAS